VDKGDPMMTHLQLPLDPGHFERWLSLFAETATEVFPPAIAATVIAKSQRIADNFKSGIALQRAADPPPHREVKKLNKFVARSWQPAPNLHHTLERRSSRHHGEN
jgi:hypothetical protein